MREEEREPTKGSWAKGRVRCQALDLQDGRAMRGVSDRSAGGSILTNDTPHGASRREPPGTSGDKG